MTRPTSALPPGALLGRYRVLAQIGRGGMGDVYKAQDTALGRTVAVKALATDLEATPDRRERFQREARAVASLSHPNLVSLFDMGEREGFPYLVYEFIEGETVEEHLKRGAIMPRTAVRWALQAAEGLAAAHDAGILHRDIKPANLMIGRDGRLRILDFGLAKFEDPRRNGVEPRTLTGAGLVVGTAQYMSPEQAMDRPVDARSDIFSLGIVLYEMVTGRPPFEGESPVDVMHAVIRTDPGPIRPPVGRSVPQALVLAVECALRKSPDERFSSMHELAAELDRILSDTDTQQLSASEVQEVIGGRLPVTPTSGARRRDLGRTRISSGPVAHPRAWAPAAVAGALVIVALALFFGRGRRGGPAGPPNPIQLTTSPGLDVFPSVSPDGRSIVYSSDRSGSFEIYRKPLASGGNEIQLTADGQANIQAAWSPDGERVAYHSRKRGGVWILPALGGVPRQLSSFGSRPGWSPDGQWVCFESDPVVDLSVSAFSALSPSVLWIVPAAGGEPRRLTEVGRPAGGHGSAAFTPDGRRVVFCAYSRRTAEIWAVDVRTRELTRVAFGPGFRYDPVPSRDGRSVYFCAVTETFANGLYRVAVGPSLKPAGEPVEIANLGMVAVKHLAISADGGKLVYAGMTMTSNLFEVPVTLAGAPAAEPRPLTRETGRNSRPAFSPDGTKVAFSKWRPGSSQDIWVLDLHGGTAVQWTTDPAEDDYPSWFPGGGRLAFATRRQGHSAVWSVDLTTGRESPLADLGPDVDFFRLSPDGTRLSFNSARGGSTIDLWTADVSGKDPRQLTFDTELMGFACWSPDGKWLAAEMKRGPDSQIALVPSTGGPPEQLTRGPGQAWPYSFSPDGDKIAFAGHRGGVWNIWWVSRTGKAQQQVTRNTKLNAYLRYPAWSPKGDRIVYEYAESIGNIWMIETSPEKKGTPGS